MPIREMGIVQLLQLGETDKYNGQQPYAWPRLALECQRMAALVDDCET
jgi:hypothetical protein